MLVGRRRWRVRRDDTDDGQGHLVDGLRRHPDQAVMQGAALVVFVVNARMMLIAVLAPACRDGRHDDRVGVCKLVHGVNVDRRHHAPGLRDQEQAEKPSTEALKPAKHCLFPRLGADPDNPKPWFVVNSASIERGCSSD